MLMFGMSFRQLPFFHLTLFLSPVPGDEGGPGNSRKKRSQIESAREEMLIYRYFAAKAFEKTTGDMSEPMGESRFCLVFTDEELTGSLVISFKVRSSRRGRYTVDQMTSVVRQIPHYVS